VIIGEAKNEKDIIIQQESTLDGEGIVADFGRGGKAQAQHTQNDKIEKWSKTLGSEEIIPNIATPLLGQTESPTSSFDMDLSPGRTRPRLSNPWSFSFLTLTTTMIATILTTTIIQAFLTRQLDPKGCAMSYMRPSFTKFEDFDTEHTRFASKYSLYLYRESGVDEDTRVC